MNPVKTHYGPKIVDWVRAMLGGQEVLPLVLVGPEKAGKSYLVEGLRHWVKVYCGDAIGEYNDTLEFVRVIYWEGGPVAPAYVWDKWITMTHPFRSERTILNRLASIAIFRDKNDIPKFLLKDTLIVELEAKGVNLGESEKLIGALVR